MAVVLSCIDSRTSPELIFDCGIGDLLSIRIAGNIVSKEITGSIELACQEIKTKLIVVMGHSNCGAVSSAIHGLNMNNISSVTQKIQPAIRSSASQKDLYRLSDKKYAEAVTMANVKNSVDEIISSSDYLSGLLVEGKVGIVAAYYDTETGKVSFHPYELHTREINHLVELAV
jgi:carbonic anhydrase